MGVKATPAIVRIERRCVYENRGYLTPCRIFPGALTNGYGVVGIGRKATARVHDVVYAHHYGVIPEGLEPDHLCRQRDCCEITHLEAVTRRENLLRGDGPRLTRARFAAQTHCKHGHEFTPDNTVIAPDRDGRTKRMCRECARLRQITYRQRKRAA